MTLSDQISILSTDKLKRVKDTMAEAGIAIEIGGNWKMIFKRAKNRRTGLERKIYELLENSDAETVRNALEAIVE